MSLGKNLLYRKTISHWLVLTQKALCKVSPHLQRLLPKVTQYRFNTVFVKHDGIPIADCLSHDIQAESALEDESTNITIAAISMFQEGKIKQIKCETSKDLTLIKLAKVVQTGWQDQHAGLDLDLFSGYTDGTLTLLTELS